MIHLQTNETKKTAIQLRHAQTSSCILQTWMPCIVMPFAFSAFALATLLWRKITQRVVQLTQLTFGESNCQVNQHHLDQPFRQGSVAPQASQPTRIPLEFVSKVSCDAGGTQSSSHGSASNAFTKNRSMKKSRKL